jgi:hypothetical protein
MIGFKYGVYISCYQLLISIFVTVSIINYRKTTKIK